MSTLLYRQNAQHTVIIDTMHTMHIDHLLSGNEWIGNNIRWLNKQSAQERLKMGFKGSSRFERDRPDQIINKKSGLEILLTRLFHWLFTFVTKMIFALPIAPDHQSRRPLPLSLYISSQKIWHTKMVPRYYLRCLPTRRLE
jgi:hypothetical protein